VSGIVTDAWLERDSPDRLVVKWAVSGSCEQVNVAWGPSPAAVDHTGEVTLDAALGAAVLDILQVARPFVSITPVGGEAALVVCERNLGFAGAYNFRDLGGYPTAGGARTRWGRVFRSDTLALKESDFEVFDCLGIRVVYDLRSDLERATTPNRLPPGDRLVECIPLASEEAVRPAIEAGLKDGEAFLADLYLSMLEHCAEDFGRILTGLADDSKLPAVFHCAAGKDRTGVVAAVLLSVLGVDEEVVLDDYELTSLYRTPEMVASSLDRLSADSIISAEAVAGILRTPRWAMRSALVEVSRRHGGIVGYATGPGRVDAQVVETLRENLLG
jgi:protein-tyrosine phosphatase